MIIPHHGYWPNIHETGFVAPTADIIGQVELGHQSSIWFQTVVRGDVNWIQIGSKTNIQDSCTLHVTRGTHPLKIGDEVTVGHRVVLHGCQIGHRVLVGMGSVIMDDVEVADDCMIGAGTLLTKGKKVPSGKLVMGSPGKVVRDLTEEELAFLRQSADNYVNDAKEYRSYVLGPVKLGQNQDDLNDEFFVSEEDVS